MIARINDLRRFRIKAELSQADFARHAGLSHFTVCRVELGVDTTPETLSAIESGIRKAIAVRIERLEKVQRDLDR